MQSLAGRELDADLTRPFRRYAVSNVLGADFTKYCQQMHQGNGGGLGGTTATHNSIEYSNESYDAKTRTVTMHAVIDWSDPYRFGDSTGSLLRRTSPLSLTSPGKSSALTPRSGDSRLPDNYRRA